ncbi:MAG TPA: O-methyltransferase [Bacteroidales bacterium]|nr:O-methyltransferase [Bacteroidales bacterium]HCI55150.1 methyltransferase [Bacteroidales bacterium]HOU96228.1 O-methyltransferase [Bacteroidales bacterium]HQG36956.1 O-methyltransferase [Bacteroidales bacterium]HQG52037.1 O-methyltransferase [Bacteroidales bacterium]
MDNDILKYIYDHITPEDPILEELFRQTHIRFVNPNMVSGHIQGRVLEIISKMISPNKILEIGTFTGYSAICLAKGLKPGGKLITIELNDELYDFSREYFEKSGLSNRIEQMTGKAQDIVPYLDGLFDLVYIDGDKREYCDYFKMVKDKVKKYGYILADNVLWGGKVMNEKNGDAQTRGIMEFNNMIIRESDFENAILPIRDGLMIIRKL